MVTGSECTAKRFEDETIIQHEGSFEDLQKDPHSQNIVTNQ